MGDGVGTGEGAGIGVAEPPKKIDGPQKEPIVSLEDKLDQGSLATLAKPNSPDFKDESDLLDEQICALSPNDYSDYLGVLFRSEENNSAVHHLSVIADRFEHDISKYGVKSYPERFIAHSIGEKTRFLIWKLARAEGVTIDPAILDRFYDFINSDNPIVRHHALENLGNLVILWNRNKSKPEGETLADRFKRDAVEKMAHPVSDKDLEIGAHMIDVAWADFGWREELFLPLMEKVENPEVIKLVMHKSTNWLGLEEARKVLREHAAQNPAFQKKLEVIEATLGFTKGQEIYNDLRRLYEKINFGEYKPNEELLAAETDLLMSQLGNTERILDIGCGTGRLMRGLKEKGKRVAGIDAVKAHVDQIKAEDSEAEVQVASWHEIPYGDEEFEAAYCLGRSFLHNTTIEDGIKFLKEAKRVLKDNGVLIVDLPDPTKGQYAKVREEFLEKAKRLGITNVELGSLNDSPDNKNFFDRLAPLPEQLTAMATLAGFQAEVVATKEYTNVEGEKDVNMYWRLVKRKGQLTAEEILDASSKLHTGGPHPDIVYI